MKARLHRLGTVLVILLILVGVTLPGPAKVHLDQKIQARLLHLERRINTMMFGPREAQFHKRDFFFGRLPPSKPGHTAAFFVLTLLALGNCAGGRRRWYCLAALCLFAPLTEGLQFFAISRTPAWQDVGRDVAGIALAAILTFILKGRRTLPHSGS